MLRDPPFSSDAAAAALPPQPGEAAAALARARAARDAGQLAAALGEAMAVWSAGAAIDEAQRAEAGCLACFCHYRLGELEPLITLGEAVLPLLHDTLTRGEMLRWLALAGAETGRFELAMRAANEANALAETGGDPAIQALALNALAACFERIGDPWQAERLMLSALAFAERQDNVFPLMATLNNLAAVTIGAFHLLRDVAAGEARAALARAEHYARRAQLLAQEKGDAFFNVFIDGNVGEALLHQGDVDAAWPLLEQALALARRHGHPTQAWRVSCTLAEGLMARGKVREARALMLAVQVEAGDALPQATALRLHDTLYRACRALGAVDEALEHLEHCDLLQRARAARQLHAQSLLMVTRVEAERARQHARDADARAAEQARHARQDALTGLGNRRQLDELLPPLLAAAEARGQPLALAMVDVDRFKLTNDCHGHRVGDLVLVELATLLRDNTRSTDLVCRMGGEEFLLVLPDLPADEAMQTCERLRRQVQQQRWGALSPGLTVTVSIGLVQAPPYDADMLYELADRALYRAKDGGRNRVCSA